MGPATGTALLSCFDASVPFMSDEALKAMNGSGAKLEYNLVEADALYSKCNQIALALTAAQTKNAPHSLASSSSSSSSSAASSSSSSVLASSLDSLPWTAPKVQLCLYADYHAQTLKGVSSAPSTAPPSKGATNAALKKTEVTTEGTVSGRKRRKIA